MLGWLVGELGGQAAGELSPCLGGTLGDEAVSAEVEGVSQSGGRPISDATNDGFRSALGDPLFPSGMIAGAWWEASPASVLPCVTPCDGALPVVRFSFIDARGVGHIFDMTSRPIPVSDSQRRPLGSTWYTSPLESTVRGVGQCRPAPSNVGLPRTIVSDFRSPSAALGVGHEPEPFPFVRGTNGGCGVHTPFRIEPVEGKITEDSGKTSEPHKSGDVFQQHP